jgi:hypothetical protein
MSALAMSFDPSFGMDTKQFTWPMEHSPSNSSIISTSELAYSHSDPSLTPPSDHRSLTSSPPRMSFTPEQRELKKQRDRARRDSRLTHRLRRTSSNTSYCESTPPPMSTPPHIHMDVTGAMSIPIYSSSPAPMSLLTEPATMGTPPYMPSYSPPMPDAATGPMFPTPFQQPLSYGMPMEYAYAPTDFTRPSSLPADPSLMYQVPAMMATGGVAVGPENGGVRVVQSRPKPRCWEHGCNGRQFSTFSNLLRHQREKSGQAAKASCPNCGAEFTRTTARNGHLLHDKCKSRRNS